MTVQELEGKIEIATWFARCGQFSGDSGVVPLREVADSDNWDWLPTSRDMADPIYGNVLVAELKSVGLDQSRREAELTVSKRVLAGLRTVPDWLPSLVDGPHDYTPAAKAGAVFAARMAVRELLVHRPGIWCQVFQLFIEGYWPCGWSSSEDYLVVL
jgi:hypothetical protein